MDPEPGFPRGVLDPIDLGNQIGMDFIEMGSVQVFGNQLKLWKENLRFPTHVVHLVPEVPNSRLGQSSAGFEDFQIRNADRLIPEMQCPNARLVQREFNGIDPSFITIDLSFIQDLSRAGGFRARQAPQGQTATHRILQELPPALRLSLHEARSRSRGDSPLY